MQNKEKRHSIKVSMVIYRIAKKSNVVSESLIYAGLNVIMKFSQFKVHSVVSDSLRPMNTHTPELNFL